MFQGSLLIHFRNPYEDKSHLNVLLKAINSMETDDWWDVKQVSAYVEEEKAAT
tara:strand:- start:561 stop:719 length:159 start_codon:yes stop_codon:yes gene_type:complete